MLYTAEKVDRPKGIISLMLAPLRVLARGNILLLLYSGLLIGGAIYLHHEAFRALGFAAPQLQADLGLSKTWVLYIDAAIFLLLGVILSPLWLTAIALPVRTLRIHGALDIQELTLLTFKSIRIGLETMIRALALSFYLLLPASAAVALYYRFHQQIAQQNQEAIYFAGVVLVCLLVLLRELPILLAPVLAICGQFESDTALRLARTTLKPRRVQMIIATIGSALITMVLFNHIPDLSLPQNLEAYAPAVISLIMAWYYISVLTIITVDAMFEQIRIKQEASAKNLMHYHMVVTDEPETPKAA